MHLASEPVAGARVDDWLTAAGVTTCRFRCPYALCAALSTAAIGPPELVLIGSDLLEDAELAIIDYVRRRWPDVPLVLYGRRCGVRRLAGRALCLDSPAALRGALRGSPDDLLRSLAETHRSQARVVEVSGGPTPQVPAAPDESSGGPQAPAPPAASDTPQPSDEQAPITSPFPLRSLLSPEELAALLEGPPAED